MRRVRIAARLTGCGRADTVCVVSDDRTATASVVLDLRGVPCPLAWAKAKVRLETLSRGTLVDIVIDDPRSLRDLPRAAEASGHQVVHVADDGPPWRIRLDV